MAKLVLKPGHIHVRRGPAVALAVNPHENMALPEVGEIEAARGIGTRAEFEHHRRKAEPLDRPAGGSPFAGQLLQRGGDENPQPLVGRKDRGRNHLLRHLLIGTAPSAAPIRSSPGTERPDHTQAVVDVYADPTPSLTPPRCTSALRCAVGRSSARAQWPFSASVIRRV